MKRLYASSSQIKWTCDSSPCYDTGIEGLEIFRDDQDREDFISRICQFVLEHHGNRFSSLPCRQ